jgi:hypothetical protein
VSGRFPLGLFLSLFGIAGCLGPRVIVRHADPDGARALVLVDEQTVGELSPGDAAALVVSPGRHRVVIRPTNRKPAPWARPNSFWVWVEEDVTIVLLDEDEEDAEDP